jgi:hypothetical protein
MASILMSQVRTRWCTAAAAIVVAATLAACGSGSPPGQAGLTSAAPPPMTAGQSPASPVEGTWKTSPFGRAAIANTLTTAGLGAHIERFFRIDETPDDLVIALRVQAGQWTAYRASGSGAPTVNDRGIYTIDGNTLLYRPNAGGLNTYRWSVTGDELTLTFVSTTEPDYEGIPNDVFQRAFYTTVAFHRA